jgi:hypothetical protein
MSSVNLNHIHLSLKRLMPEYIELQPRKPEDKNVVRRYSILFSPDVWWSTGSVATRIL